MTATVTRQLLVLCIGLSLGTAACAAGSGVYRWTDDQGNVHYSDKPPKEAESEYIRKATGTRSAPPAPEASSEETADDKTKTAAIEGGMEVLPAKDPKLCAQGRSNLEALSGNPRIRITDEDGSKRFLTEDEKETQRANARKYIELYCE